MLSNSFKDAVLHIMGKVANEIPDAHKKYLVNTYIVGGT